MNKVTVLIPIGPKPVYQQYLPEALSSVFRQTYPVDEILLVDDGAGITDQKMHDWLNGIVWLGLGRYGKQVWTKDAVHVSLYKLPWNVGFSQAFNCGVGVAENDLILYLAADDTLGPDAVQDCLEVYEEYNHRDAWYSLTYESADGACDIPINASMITRKLWAWTKGYPPSAFAGPDALLLSCLLKHAPDRIIPVKSGKVNYHIKKHAEQETATQFGFFAASGIMEVIRDMETRRFEPNGSVVLK